jgi:7,8-dihydropterin-6-yl-methyl-4-(beta-D-ribofuranosyl)aminobenzene 5'-phosphate synthase
MKKILYFSFYILLFIYGHNIFAQKITNNKITEENVKMKITILYDNYVYTEGTLADWGFACLIEDSQNTVLFDTGTKADILMHNIKALNVDISKIDVIVISHNHNDHTGGLEAVLERKANVKVYMPYSTSSSEKDRISRFGASVITEKESKKILNNVYLTGEMGDEIKEQSLILDTSQGLVIITGCSHPGIINILKRSQEIINKKIHLVLGGFHLVRHSEKEVNNIIGEFKKLGVEQCGCSHCTGDEAIDLFSKAYAENFIKIGTGKVINVQN